MSPGAGEAVIPGSAARAPSALERAGTALAVTLAALFALLAGAAPAAFTLHLLRSGDLLLRVLALP